MTMTRAAPTVTRSAPEHAGTCCPPGHRTALPAIVADRGPVVALRRRRVIALGALGAGTELDGERLVSARDLSGRPWWIPAAAVWTDGEAADRPEHPWHVGLATDSSWARAVLAGLSDRLGWEASRARAGGQQLAPLDDVDAASHATVWDGRLGHDVPTVLVAGDAVERWGAGVSVSCAYRRAMFGDHGTHDAARELADVELVLAAAGMRIGVVDLATPLMARAGVARVSVQLLGTTHDPVRRWDAGPIE
jgi:hypothetical protein